jgi:hypothetical protein
MTIQPILDQLRGRPVDIATLLQSPAAGGLPTCPGLYAWWVQHGALPQVPPYPHPTQPGWSLLYIGIAPYGPRSPATIRSRVRGQHIGGNTGSSTFRQSLAALLMDTLGFHPIRRHNDYNLPPAENARLSAWQRQHLRLTWAEHATPWLIEPAVIAALHPPLNLDHNSAHPFYQTMTTARARYKAAARPVSPL